MKTIRIIKAETQQCFLPAFAGIMLLCSAAAASAQDLVVDSFDNAASIGYGNTPGLDWSNFRGYNVTTVWDPGLHWELQQRIDVCDRKLAWTLRS
jgi:hypothetical protein